MPLLWGCSSVPVLPPGSLDVSDSDSAVRTQPGGLRDLCLSTKENCGVRGREELAAEPGIAPEPSTGGESFELCPGMHLGTPVGGEGEHPGCIKQSSSSG